MPKRAWCAALIVSGLVVAPARAAGDDSEIRRLVNDVWAGWNTLDPDKAVPFYAKDADLVFFDLAPLKFTGWRQFKEGVPVWRVRNLVVFGRRIIPDGRVAPRLHARRMRPRRSLPSGRSGALGT